MTGQGQCLSPRPLAFYRDEIASEAEARELQPSERFAAEEAMSAVHPNTYVNEANRQVFGPVGIDQQAGPSEIFVVADETGAPEMIATDLLAQAEHDVRTRVGLITTDRSLAEATLARSSVSSRLCRLPTSPGSPGATTARSPFAKTRRR